MTPKDAWVLAVGLVGFLGVGCPQPELCTTGTTQECPCPGGLAGASTCTDGVFGLCVCDDDSQGEGEGEGAGEGEGEGEGEDEGPCVDLDDDGFFTCVDPAFPERSLLIDCNDRQPSIAPGGIEFPGNGIDDNCNDDVDEAATACSCLGDGSDADLVAGIGLCGADVVSSSTEGFADQRGAFDAFFELQPHRGDGCLSVLSTGVVSADAETNVFDPTVSGLSFLLVKTQQTEDVASVTCTLDGEPLVPCEQIQDLTIFDPGVHVLTMAAVDIAGNVEPVPLRLNFGFDDIAVEAVDVVVVFPAEGDRVGERTPTISGTGTPGGFLFVTLTGPDDEEVELSASIDEAGGWSVNPQDNQVTLARGPWQLTVGTFDADGQVIQAAPVSFVVDTVGGDNVPPDSSLRLDFDGRLQLTVTEDECDVVCTVDDQPFPCDPGTLALPSELSDGRHVVRATATDPAGNTELLAAQVTFVPSPTTLTIASPTAGQTTSEVAFTIIGTTVPNSFIDIFVDDGQLPPAVPSSFSSTQSDATGRFVYPGASLPPLSNGAHVLRFESSSFSSFDLLEASVTVTVDTTATDTTPPATIAVGGFSSSLTDTSFFGLGVDPISGAEINDPSAVTVELRVPPNALGFQFDLMFVSVEWPEFLCDFFNDTFEAVLESSAVDDGAPTNVAFDINNNPITVNVGFFELPSEWTTDLSSLPHAATEDFEQTCSQGSAQGCTLPEYCDGQSNVSFKGTGSGWLTTRAPVTPGETLRLTFLVFDEADFALDSVAFLDGFRWLPFAPPVGTVKEEED